MLRIFLGGLHSRPLCVRGRIGRVLQAAGAAPQHNGLKFYILHLQAGALEAGGHRIMNGVNQARAHPVGLDAGMPVHLIPNVDLMTVWAPNAAARRSLCGEGQTQAAYEKLHLDDPLGFPAPITVVGLRAQWRTRCH